MVSLIGQRLGQYEITALLGKGGMATVYRARQASIGRDVALKVIRADLAQSEEFIGRFDREAKTIAQLSHPQILKLFDYGQQDDLVYLVMELHESGSLEQLSRSSSLSLTAIERILEQIASALNYAHQQGIIHRDLKPQNVLMDRHQNAILTDFGIAKLLHETTTFTREGMLVGTPAYMSPEQWRGEPLTARVDIYALGVILFELLMGRVPYSGDTHSAIMYQHLEAVPPSVRAVRQDLPQEIDTIIGTALHKDPAQRYQSALDLVEAFKMTLGHASPSLHRTDAVTAKTGSIPALPTSDPATLSIGDPTAISLQMDSPQVPQDRIVAVVPKPERRLIHSRVFAATVSLALLTLALSGLFAGRLLQTGDSKLGIVGLSLAIVNLISIVLIAGIFRLKSIRHTFLVAAQGLLLAAIVVAQPPLLNNLTDDLATRTRQAAITSQSRQTTDLLRALAILNPERARQLIGEFNDSAVDAQAASNLTLAHNYLEAIHALDSDETLDIGRDKIAKSISRYNLGTLREQESDPQGAISAYREAIALDDANLDARNTLSSFLLLYPSQDPDALDTAINISNLGWKNYIPDALCHGNQNLADSDTFQKVWTCFALKTTEAGARLARNHPENGDTSAVIESLARSAVNLAKANGDFHTQGYFTAEAYYYLAKVTAPKTTADILCGILANLDTTNPRHRPWADYANEQIALQQFTCDR
jgi:serine/threonine protein kinase